MTYGIMVLLQAFGQYGQILEVRCLVYCSIVPVVKLVEIV